MTVYHATSDDKVIGGVWYHPHGWSKSKAEAMKYADYVRKKTGKSVRVIKSPRNAVYWSVPIIRKMKNSDYGGSGKQKKYKETPGGYMVMVGES